MNEIEKTGHLVLYSKFKPKFNLTEVDYSYSIEETLTNLTFLESAYVDYFEHTGDIRVVDALMACELVAFPWWIVILPAAIFIGSCINKLKERKK